jgi:preprotein translocase subunit SecF
MWILHFLPDAFILWFCNILLLVGIVLTIAGFFAHRIPLVWQYQLPFKFVGIALLVLGVYFRGGYAVEMQWRERVAEVEAKLAQAEKQSQEANVKLETKGKEKIRVIKEKGQVIKQYIDREVTKYDSTCNIPDEVVKAHNAAAKNEAIK